MAESAKADDRRQILRVLLAQAGDRQALDELLRSIQEPLLRYVSSIVRDPQLAEDVLQEVFVLICRKLRWLREPAYFRAWAYRIASRSSLRALEKEHRLTDRREPALELETIAELPLEEAYDRELIARLPGLLASVSRASRTVLSLHYLHEMTLSEVADVLGLSEGTVKSRLAYGLSTLRKHLQVSGA